MKQTKIFWGFLLLIIALVTGCSKEGVGNNDSVDQDPGLYYQIGNGTKTLWDAETFKSALTDDNSTVSISTVGGTKMNSTNYKDLLDAINSSSCTGLTLDFSGAMAEEDAMVRYDINEDNKDNKYNGIKAVAGFPVGITLLEYAFWGFTNLTSIAEIPNSIIDMTGTFSYCTSFNQQITIPDSVIEMNHTFAYCTSFNQQITIPESVIEMYATFAYCTNFNQQITIPDSVTDMRYTFYKCIQFNKSITIPENVTNMYATFAYCTNLNQPITIPNSVTSVEDIFYDCPALASTITIYGASSLITTEAFDGTTNTANIDLILGSERASEWTEGSNTWAGYTFKSITRAE